MAINWEKGFFRFWSIGSLIWVVFVFAIYLIIPREFEFLGGFSAALSIALIPTIAAFILVKLITWGLKGFTKI
jgi:hypothetical protein